MIATLIIIAVNLIYFGVHIAKHGQPKQETYNYKQYFITLIIIGILYYYAGLFDNFK